MNSSLLSFGSDNNPSMTSAEIAELVESHHPDVRRSIKRLADRGVIQLPPTIKIEDTQSLSPNNKTRAYVFIGEQGRRDSYVIVAKISPQRIGAIVDAWGRTSATLQDLLTALEAFDIPDDLPPDLFIYAIREQDTGHIKLGISRDPSARLAQLQTGNSSKLQLVAVRPAVSRFADERAVHADAEAHRLRGEWFTASALSVLQKLN